MIKKLLAGIRTAQKQHGCTGIDLTGSEHRAPGICVLQGRDAILSSARTDEELLRCIDTAGTGVVMYPAKDHGTHDELDALTSALVGYFYLAGSYEAIGNATEGYLILPDPAGIPDR